MPNSYKNKKSWTVSNARGESNNVEGIDLLVQDYDGDMVEKYAFRLAWPHFCSKDPTLLNEIDFKR